MIKGPLVSIIINNYNYGRFLKEAIDSALGQTYENIEVIVVDDGSSDESGDIINSFGNRIIPVFKSNGGQASAYNAGFEKSNGLFICNLDADDTLLNNAIVTSVPLFIDERVVKVQWPLYVVDEKGQGNGEISTKWTPPDGDLKEFVLKEGPFYDFHLTTGSLLKRIFVETVFPMTEPEYRNGADVYLITLAPLFGKIKNASAPLGTYRAHGKNNYRNNKLDESRIRNYISRFEQNCIELKKYSEIIGIKSDIELWKIKNFNYIWPTRLLNAKKDISQHIPAGEKYLLINSDEWDEMEPVEGRNAIVFPSENGVYTGLPIDDDNAINQLNNWKANGVKYVIFWWTTFWWLDYYVEFRNYLTSSFTCLLKNERVILYYLQE